MGQTIRHRRIPHRWRNRDRAWVRKAIVGPRGRLIRAPGLHFRRKLWRGVRPEDARPMDA
jgi:hypothetical protein